MVRRMHTRWRHGLPPVILTFIFVLSTFPNLSAVQDASGQAAPTGTARPLANPFTQLNYSIGIAVDNGSQGIAFDPTDGSFFSTTNSNYVTEINESTWKVTGGVGVPSGDYAMIGVDPIHQLGFVTGGTADDLSIFNVSTLQTLVALPTGGGSGVAVDPAHELVTFSNGPTLSILNYASMLYVANLTVSGSPGRMGYDPAKNLAAFAYQGGSSELGIVNDTTHRWVVNATTASGPVAVAYDPASGDFVVTCTSEVTLVDPSPPYTTSNYSLPSSGSNGNSVTVVNGGADEALIWEYWGTGGAQLQPFDISRGTFPHAVPYVSSSYPAAISSDPQTRVAVGVDPSNDVPYLPNVTGPYAVNLTETGLTAGTDWCVSLVSAKSCSTTPTIEFHEPNGALSFSVGPVAGYVPTPASGSVTVSNGPAHQAIVFSGAAVVRHYVNFTESGLPASTSWSVTLNWITESSTSSTISFLIPQGLYAYTVGKVAGYSSLPSSGLENDTSGSISQSVVFRVPASQYPVTFKENGLPAGTLWSVILGGINSSSTSASIAYNETNGSYAYTVGGVAGYTAAPSAGNLTVNGSPLSVPVTFTPKGGGHYDVYFNETGLPASTTWSVTLNGSTLSSALSSIVFPEKNGTFAWSIGAVVGYTSSPTHGNSTVNGGRQVVTLTFSPATLSSVAVTPASTTIDVNATMMFTAQPTCTASCPTTINYTWALNSSLGTLNSAFGGFTNVTAGARPGVVELNVTATLNGVTRTAGAVFTVVKPTPTLSSVSITPVSLILGVGNTTNFTAKPNCSGGPCPTGAVYEWALETASLGTLNSGFGPTASFTAGKTAGIEIVFATADLNSIEATGIAEINITAGPVPVLKSISLDPTPTAIVQVGHVQHFTASATCNIACPTYTLFVWAVNNSRGTVVGSGDAANFTAGSSPGLINLSLVVELNDGSLRTATNITITSGAVPTLTGVAVTPVSSTLTVGGTKAISADPVCTPTACGSFNVTYVWSLNDSLGNLTATSGPAVVFIAGSAPGYVEVTVKASYNGHSVSNSSYLIISKSTPPPTNNTSSSPGFLGLPGDDGYFLLLAIVVVAAIVAAALVLRKRQGASPPGSPPDMSGYGYPAQPDPYAGYGPPPEGGYSPAPPPEGGFAPPPQ